MGGTRSLSNLVTAIDNISLSPDELDLWSSAFAWTKRVELCEQFVHNELLNGDTYLSGSSTPQHSLEVLTGTTEAAKRLLAHNFPAKRKDRYNVQQFF